MQRIMSAIISNNNHDGLRTLFNLLQLIILTKKSVAKAYALGFTFSD